MKKAKVIEVKGVRYVTEAHHIEETTMLLSKLKEREGLTFHVDPDKAETANEWLEKHPCEMRGKPHKAAIGVSRTYIFTDTSIGRMETVECPWGHKLFLSDDL